MCAEVGLLTSAAAESTEKQQKRKQISAVLISPVVQMCPSAGETFPTGAAKMLQPAWSQGTCLSTDKPLQG